MNIRRFQRNQTRSSNNARCPQETIVRKVTRGIFVFSFLLVYCSGLTLAQQGRDARIVLTTGGPTAAVRVLAFSSDSRHLYAAGADKAVEIWSLPETRAAALDLKLVDHARWPIARADRGQIWTLSINEAKSLIAFGGYGAQQISGDISIADSSHGRQVTILPTPIPDEDPMQRFVTGHLQTVNSVSFSPNGEWLASISLDGDVRLWSVGNWKSQQILPAGSNPTLSSVYVQFISKNQFVASLNQGTDPKQPVSQLILFTIGTDQKVTPETLSSSHQGLITALGAVSKSDRWYSGDANGELVTWQGGKPLRSKSPFKRIPVRSISTSTNGNVLILHSPTAAAIAAGKEDSAYAELENISETTSVLLERREWKFQGETLAAVLSADGKYAAMTRPGEAAIEVFSLVDPRNNQSRHKPFSTQRPTVLAGSGSTVRRVQFVRQPETMLAISTNVSGEWTHGFNLATAEVVRPSVLGQMQPAHASPDWKIDVGPSIEGLEQTLVIRANGTERAKLTLSHQGEGHYASHGWIFETGQDLPSAVAIGTLRQNGIFVFDLRQPGRAPMIRYYRDHTNAVNSLSQSADGRYLASSSQDQTIRIWSLDGLLTQPAGFSNRAAWGGDFEIRDGTLVAASLLEFGILSGRRLKDSDQIVKIALHHEGQRLELTDPQQMLKALEFQPLTESVEIHAARAGAILPPFIVTPAWEPMTTLFIDRRNEWAAWTPAGYYNSSVDGDELFGFQINPLRRGDEPKFSRAEQLRDQYERPDLLQKLFALGSLSDALKAVAIVPQNPGTIVAQMPRVQLNGPVSMTTYPLGAEVTIAADIDFNNIPAEEFKIEGWINGAKLGPPIPSVFKGLRRFSWTISPPPGDYQALVKVESLGPTLSAGLYSDAQVPFVMSGQPDMRTVHVLAIGANNYQGDLKLNFCINDAQDFVKLIGDSAGPHYRIGVVKVIVDDNSAEAGQFEKETFQRQLSQFATQIKQTPLKSNDMVMIFLAGLGEVVGKEYFFVPPVSEIKNLSQLAVLQRHSIPWSAFRGLIEDLPNCGKVFFLDTCYAGNIARLESEKARLRPLKNLNTVVFAATTEELATREDDQIRHGRFTAFLLDGLGGSADGSTVDPNLAGFPPVEPDGRISLLETVGFVSRRVYEKWRNQQPKYTPVSLIRFLNDPIIDVVVPAKGGN
jgi:WD40 repeat protein